MGGTSSERDVSLASGLRIAEALRSRGHDVRAVDTAKGALSLADEQRMLSERVVKQLPPSPGELARMNAESLADTAGRLPKRGDCDVAFLALHGGRGEDGTVQALLDLAGVPYTGSGHLASALAMDKDLSKHLFRAHDVGTANWLMATDPSRLPDRAAVERALGWPVIVKPSKQGSTVGLSIVKQPSELEAAIAEAFEHDDEVMIEQFIAGRELTVGVLGIRRFRLAKSSRSTRFTTTNASTLREWPSRNSRRNSATKKPAQYRVSRVRHSTLSSSVDMRGSISGCRRTVHFTAWRRTRFQA